MGVDHAWETFSSEIRLALVSNASLQERLAKLISGTCHLQRESFPDDHAWDEFRKLVKGTTKWELLSHPEGNTHAATSRLSDDKAKRYLETAFDIYSRIAKAFGRTEFVI